ncbi:MAG: tyrosine--tRNA ligase [bacterium]|nr:tyrosine--tRNA ligase [bacterium]
MRDKDLENTALAPEVRAELDRQWEIIRDKAVDVLPEDEFKAKLARSISENKPLRIKQGFDPTSPDIHLGHTVGIRKLKQFQDLGHTIILIVGDYTGLVGDPSGRSATRPQLSYDEITKNAETYQDQFFRVLERSKCEVVSNGDWFKKMSFTDIMNLTSRYTVARILERDDFAKRMQANAPISVHELLYPLMQAYDSVAIKADVEIGGTDQKFNLLVGRTIQEAYGIEPQCILTMPILVGTDGHMKMSKSLGNYIGVDDPPRDMFGKAMSIPDGATAQYFQLVTDVEDDELGSFVQQFPHPMELKKKLGETLVDMYHEPGSGKSAREEFERMFAKKELPDDMPEVTGAALKEMEVDPASIYLVHLIAKMKMSKSNSEARKLIQSNSVSLDGEKVTDVNHEFSLTAETVLKVGKRRFLRLIP